MNTLIISAENNILHISNEGYKADYTIYNSKGHNLDGGVLESSHGSLNSKNIIDEIISIIKENFSFSKPYICLKGENCESLLELIEAEDYKHTQEKVTEFLTSIHDKADLVNEEMEHEK